MVLPKNYYFLPVTSNNYKGQIRVKLFCPINSQKVSIHMHFAQKLRFSSPFKATVTSIKGQISFGPINSQQCQFPCVFAKNYDFWVLIRLSSFILPVTSNNRSVRVNIQCVQIPRKKFNQNRSYKNLTPISFFAHPVHLITGINIKVGRVEHISTYNRILTF